MKTIEQLRAEFPDLVKKIEENATSTYAQKTNLLTDLTEAQKGEIARLKLENGDLKKAAKPVAPEESADPEVVLLKQQLAELKAEKQRALMENEVDTAIENHKYKKFIKKLRPLVINEKNVPASADEISKRIKTVEHIVFEVLTAYREGNADFRTPPAARPYEPQTSRLRIVEQTPEHDPFDAPDQRSPEEEQAHEEALARLMGDTEEDVG